MSPSSSGRSSASGSTSSSEADPRTRGLPLIETARYRHVSESSRPRAVSDSVNSKGPVSKVMDLFRNRSNSAVSAEEKRRPVSNIFWPLVAPPLCIADATRYVR